MKKRQSLSKLEVDLIECFIDDTLSRSRKVAALTKAVIEAQRELRAVVDDDGWSAYLDVERAVNERASKQLRVIFRRVLLLQASGALRS